MFSMYEDPVFALRSVAPAEDLSRQLSPREFEVLRLLVAGVPLRDFVRQLALTPKTVANYQSILRQKLGAENTLQLLQVATRMGIAQESGLA